MESETEGLVRFTCVAHGTWLLSSAYQQYGELTQLTTEQVKAAAGAYIHELRGALLPAIEIFDHIENEEVLRAARSWT
jgi:hypothetical protein